MRSSAWALALTGAALALVWSGCAREPGELAPGTGVPVNEGDLIHGNCIKGCEPDYGSEPVDCATAEYPYEFFPGAPPGGGTEASVPVWSFEEHGPPKNDLKSFTDNDGYVHPGYQATALYSYSDKTTVNLVVSATCFEQTGDPTHCDPNEYEPEASEIERCGSLTHALHLRGGPFKEWGGGVGRRLENFATDAALAYASANPALGFDGGCTPMKNGAECSDVMPSAAPDPATCKTLAPVRELLPNQAPFCPKPETCIDCAAGVTQADGSNKKINDDAYYSAQVDLRQWDGISFWARRGPDSERVLRIGLGDRNTDDDMSFLMSQGGVQTRCQRAKECGCKDQERSCQADPNTGAFWCLAPYDAYPSEVGGTDEQLEQVGYVRCAASACDAPYPAYPDDPDLSFATSSNSDAPSRRSNSCGYYMFPNETNGYYCYDAENGPLPVYASDKCGDPWAFPVDVNPDWTFYAIPFTDLHQDGYAKEFGTLDLAAVTMVRFLWPAGSIDFWIDDVRFYRRRPE